MRALFRSLKLLNLNASSLEQQSLSSETKCTFLKLAEDPQMNKGGRELDDITWNIDQRSLGHKTLLAKDKVLAFQPLKCFPRFVQEERK